MSDTEKNNKKEPGRGSKKKAAAIFSIVFVLVCSIVGCVILLARRKENKSKANVDAVRKDGDVAKVKSSRSKPGSSGPHTESKNEDALQETTGDKLQQDQRVQQLNKASPGLGDACVKLEKDLKADGIWNLSELEANFNALRTHSKKDEIVALHPELAAGSVYEGYFGLFKDKISTLLKGNGLLNILNATDMMDHLARNCKPELDEWISSECAQPAATNVISDQCYYLRKASIIQGMKDAFNNCDFPKFKDLLNELINLRLSCSTSDESINAVINRSNKEYDVRSFAKYLFAERTGLEAKIAEDKGDNLPTRIGKLNHLKQICDLLEIDTNDIVAKKKELILNVVDRNNINDPNVVKIIKDKTLGMDPNDLDVPYFTTQPTSDKALEFWRAQQCKMILIKSKLDDAHTSANALLEGKSSFKDRWDVEDYVKASFDIELERLKTGITPPNVEMFMETVKLLIRLHRSLKDQKNAEREILNLRNEENTEIRDVIISLMGHQLINGRFEEFEVLAKFAKEIKFKFKLPGTNIEISTKDEFDEARRIIVVRSVFHSVADGAFTSTLPQINAELLRFGLMAIDEAAVRRILVRVGMFGELLKSDDPNHTQYKAIKSEMSIELKDFVESLNVEVSVFKEKFAAFMTLMNAWRDVFDATDEVEPKYVRPNSVKPSDDQMKAEINPYYCKFLTEKVKNLSGSLRTTVVPGCIEMLDLAMYISNFVLDCEIQDSRRSIIDDETFYATENTATYDQKTDLSNDPYFQKYKAIYSKTRGPAADAVIILNLYLANPPSEPAKFQSCNLLVYHYLVPEILKYEYKAGCSDRAVANESRVDLYQLIQLMSRGLYERAQAMTLRVLRTQNIAGRDGNGLIMFWHDQIGDDALAKLYCDLQEAKAIVVDPLIINALGNLKGAYSRATTTPELKRVYIENYEVLKSLHSNPNDFPPLF